MALTATWHRSAEIVSREEAAAFFADRTIAKRTRSEGERRRSATLSGCLVKR